MNIIFTAKEQRINYMDSLGLSYGYHEVNRNSLYTSDVIELYEIHLDEVLKQYPFRVHF
jgi:hypothetical protein